MPQTDQTTPKEIIDSSAYITARECEILTQIAEGKKVVAIADLLCISQQTVRTHIKNVRLRLDAVNTINAVTIAIVHGLINPFCVLPPPTLRSRRKKRRTSSL